MACEGCKRRREKIARALAAARERALALYARVRREGEQ